MPSQNDSMLSETRATRPIYHVYSVYPLIAIVEYYEASCRGRSTGQCQHLPNWVLWFGVSWALTPIVECSTTLFVCACWCKSHCLGVWNFILCWSIHTNTHLHPLCWLYKISHDMWEPTSKLGASIWHFIRLLIRTIPLYLRDHKRHWSGDSDSAKKAVKKRIIFSAG